MVRTDNDTWDLASSVGATATMVAAARAMATSADNALIDDPFAEPLVRAVGVDVFARLASGELAPADLDDDPTVGMQRMVDNVTSLMAEANSFGLAQPQILLCGASPDAARRTRPIPEGTLPVGTDIFRRCAADVPIPPTAEAAGPLGTC